MREVRSNTQEPRLDVTTVPFDLSAEHDLLSSARLFGLATASEHHARVWDVSSATAKHE